MVVFVHNPKVVEARINPASQAGQLYKTTKSEIQPRTTQHKTGRQLCVACCIALVNLITTDCGDHSYRGKEKHHHYTQIQ